MGKTTIEWTDMSANPIRARHKVTGKVGWHCVAPSPGCANCYSRVLNGRFGTGLPYNKRAEDEIELFLDMKSMEALRKRRKPAKVFLCDMTDLFGEFVPFAWIDDIMATIVVSQQHTFQILTKRPWRMVEYFGSGGRYVPKNAWLGTSVEDQKRADERIPVLAGIPATVRFLSVEPLLGPVDLTPWLGGGNASDECRRGRVSGRRDGGVADRRRGLDLESGSPTVGSVGWSHPVDPVQTATGGEGIGGLPPGQSDDRSQAGTRPGPPTGVAALLRPDPRWIDCQSQGREQTPKSSGQPGVGDPLRADPSRDPRSGLPPGTQLSWVIVGGESGHGARPCDVAWIRSIRDQCEAAEVPLFVKQLGARPIRTRMTGWGENPNASPRIVEDDPLRLRDPKGGDIDEWPEDLRVREFPAVVAEVPA